MLNYKFRNAVVLGILGLLVFSCLSTAGLSTEKTENTIQIDNYRMVEENKFTNAESNEAVFDWPMFRHDNNHTGYTKGVGDIKAPVKKWTNKTKDLVFSSPAIGNIDNDGALEVVVGSNDKKVYALYGTNGTEKWRFPTGGRVYSSPAIGDIDNDGQVEVVVGSDDHKLYAINGRTGEEKWRFTTGDGVQSSPALGDIDNDGQIDIVVFGSYDYNVYALYGTNGTEKWRFTTGHSADTSPAIGDIDNDEQAEVVIGSYDHNVYALYGTTGEEKWRFPTGGRVYSSPAIGDIDNDGQVEVVVGSDDHKLYAINGRTGEEKWNYLTGDMVKTSPAIGDIDNDGQVEVVVGSDDGYIHAINGTTGEKKWKFRIGYLFAPAWSSPAICDIDNDTFVDVVVGSNDGYIYAINGTTGEEKWKFATQYAGSVENAAVFSSPALGDIDDDGFIEVVVGCYDKKVYALDDDETPPECEIVKPREGFVYLKNVEVMPFFMTVVLGGITVQVDVSKDVSRIDRVEFNVNGELKGLGLWNPIKKYWEWDWYEFRCGLCTLEVVAWDKAGRSGYNEIGLFYCCIRGLPSR